MELACLLRCSHQGRPKPLQPPQQDTFAEREYSEVSTNGPSSWLDNLQGLTMSKALNTGSCSWLGPKELSRTGQGWAQASWHPSRQRFKDRGMHSCQSWPGTHPALAHASQVGTGNRSTHIWPGNESMIAPGSGLCENPDVRAFLSSRTSGF